MAEKNVILTESLGKSVENGTGGNGKPVATLTLPAIDSDLIPELEKTFGTVTTTHSNGNRFAALRADIEQKDGVSILVIQEPEELTKKQLDSAKQALDSTLKKQEARNNGRKQSTDLLSQAFNDIGKVADTGDALKVGTAFDDKKNAERLAAVLNDPGEPADSGLGIASIDKDKEGNWAVFVKKDKLDKLPKENITSAGRVAHEELAKESAKEKAVASKLESIAKELGGKDAGITVLRDRENGLDYISLGKITPEDAKQTKKYLESSTHLFDDDSVKYKHGKAGTHEEGQQYLLVTNLDQIKPEDIKAAGAYLATRRKEISTEIANQHAKEDNAIKNVKDTLKIIAKEGTRDFELSERFDSKEALAIQKTLNALVPGLAPGIRGDGEKVRVQIDETKLAGNEGKLENITAGTLGVISAARAVQKAADEKLADSKAPGTPDSTVSPFAPVEESLAQAKPAAAPEAKAPKIPEQTGKPFPTDAEIAKLVEEINRLNPPAPTSNKSPAADVKSYDLKQISANLDSGLAKMQADLAQNAKPSAQITNPALAASSAPLAMLPETGTATDPASVSPSPVPQSLAASGSATPSQKADNASANKLQDLLKGATITGLLIPLAQLPIANASENSESAAKPISQDEAYAKAGRREKLNFESATYQIAPGTDNISFNLVQEGDKAHYMSGKLAEKQKLTVFRSTQDVVLDAATTLPKESTIKLADLKDIGSYRTDGKATNGKLGLMLEKDDTLSFTENAGKVAITITDKSNNSRTVTIEGANLSDIKIGKKSEHGHQGMVTLQDIKAEQLTSQAKVADAAKGVASQANEAVILAAQNVGGKAPHQAPAQTR